MDTIVFHCFSATGNTARAVQRCAAALAARGHRVSLLPITAASLASPPAADHLAVHVIAFPVLGFGPPDTVKRYIRALSRAVTKETGLRAAILASCAGEPLQALEETEQMLRRRGFEVLASASAAYPYNWTQVISAQAGDIVRAQLETGDAEAGNFAAKLDHYLVGGAPITAPAPPRLVRSGIINRLWSGLVQFLFASLGRRFLGAFFTASADCSGCGLCARHCPSRTIRMHGTRPAWGGNCSCCNRCINICPESAIQVSIVKFAVQLALNVGGLVGIILLCGSLLPDSGLLKGFTRTIVLVITDIALFALLCALQLGPLNRLLNLAARWRPLTGLFAASWTRGFRRWRAPDWQPDRL